MTLTIGSLFSGIGGLELGLEWAGLGPVLWQVEIDPFCRRVLAKHWPNVTRFEDVTRPRNYPAVDLICGGFPCQDVSSAGRRRGIGGARSSLWWHYAGVIRQVGPSFVVVENVASGAKGWLPYVRHQLHVLGYRTRALSLSAFDVGAPHLRRRVFVVGTNPRGQQLRKQRKPRVSVEAPTPLAWGAGEARPLAGTDREGQPQPSKAEFEGWRWSRDGDRWAPEPPVRGVAHGVPRRLDRLRALGNAVVPMCAATIGRVIQEQCT